MDPALCQQPVAIAPRAADDQVLMLPGAFVPVLLPLACLPPEVRATVLEQLPDAPVSARVDAAIACGRVEDAWRLVRTVRGPLDANPGLERVLSQWQAEELGRLQLTQGDGAVLAVGDASAAQELATRALADVRSVLDPWPWPRWIGPALLVPANGSLSGLAADAPALVRPVLPIVRLSVGATRESLAEAWMRLALALSAPPTDGWPAWLEDGLVQYARVHARDRNNVVSPDAMAQTRARAGGLAIAAALAGASRTQELDLALVQLLLHPRHRSHFDSALDLLRSGARSVDALRIAFGWSPDDIAQAR